MIFLKRILDWFQTPSDPQTDINPSEYIQVWESKRRLGLFKYILVHGFIYWAFPLGISLSLLNFLFFSHPISSFHFSDAIGWILAGAFIGLLKWRTSERRYKKFINEKKAAEQDAAANP